MFTLILLKFTLFIHFLIIVSYVVMKICGYGSRLRSFYTEGEAHLRRTEAALKRLWKWGSSHVTLKFPSVRTKNIVDMFLVLTGKCSILKQFLIKMQFNNIFWSEMCLIFRIFAHWMHMIFRLQVIAKIFQVLLE